MVNAELGGDAPLRSRRQESVMTPKIPWAMLAVAMLLAGCQEPAPPAPDVRPVRTVTVERRAGGEPVSLTGQIRAQDQVGLAFRLDGRMLERRVNVGDQVKPGQAVDPPQRHRPRDPHLSRSA